MKFKSHLKKVFNFKNKSKLKFFVWSSVIIYWALLFLQDCASWSSKAICSLIKTVYILQKGLYQDTTWSTKKIRKQNLSWKILETG